ncbi:MAG: hypothetical protein WEE50_01340 [Chloroflexota bacterium]
MPEFTLKEVRLPELHLPEIKRDDIVRSLSGARLPEVDLARARNAGLKVPAIAVTSADLGRLVAAGATIARFVRPASRRGRLFGLPLGRRSGNPVVRLVQPRTRRSRWPVLLIVAGAVAIGAWALLRQPSIRRRVDEVAREARERLAAMGARDERLDIDPDKPIAPGSVATASTEADDFANATEDAGAATPTDDDAGPVTASGDTNGIPAFEEAAGSPG